MAPLAAALPVIGAAAGVVQTGAQFGAGIAAKSKERRAGRKELIEGITTTRENIAGKREQIGLLGSQTQQVLAEQQRQTGQELGSQRASFAGSGVTIGAGGSAGGLRTQTKELRGEERRVIQETAGVQGAQLERELQQLGRSEEAQESALRQLGKGGLFGKRGLIGRKHRKTLKSKGFEFTKGF